MRIEVKVPQLPESVAEATLVNWHKRAGEAVKRDENLIDIETDKVVLELPAPGDGVLVEITRPDGSTVTSNDVIAVIDTDGKSDGVAGAKSAAAAVAAPAPAVAAAKPADSATALPAARVPSSACRCRGSARESPNASCSRSRRPRSSRRSTK